MVHRATRVTWSVTLSALVGGAVVLCSAPAVASFDVVGVYHEKVKQFEAVYFLEADEEWHRDRRIVELFFEGDWLRYANPLLDRFVTPEDDNKLTLFSGSVGMLVNIRPERKSKVQLSIFNILNSASKPMPTEAFTGSARPSGSGGSVTEVLHGARLTVGEAIEASLGGYWLIDKVLPWQSGTALDVVESSQGSFFFELNSPFLFSKSSYVIGKDLTGRDGQLKRFDARFAYDQLLFVENLEAGVIRYAFTDQPKWMLAATVTRLGHPVFKFLSADVRYSLTDGKLAWFRGGLDVLLQADDDFNLTRRGHFGTSFGLKALYTRATPDAFQVFDVLSNASAAVSGYELTAYCQIPAKWFWTAVAVAGAVAAQGSDMYSAEQKEQILEQAMSRVEATIEEPRDIVFTRITFTMSKNAPETYAILGEPEGRTRYFASLSFIY